MQKSVIILVIAQKNLPVPFTKAFLIPRPDSCVPSSSLKPTFIPIGDRRAGNIHIHQPSTTQTRTFQRVGERKIKTHMRKCEQPCISLQPILHPHSLKTDFENLKKKSNNKLCILLPPERIITDKPESFKIVSMQSIFQVPYF